MREQMIEKIKEELKARGHEQMIERIETPMCELNEFEVSVMLNALAAIQSKIPVEF